MIQSDCLLGQNLVKFALSSLLYVRIQNHRQEESIETC